MKLEGGKRKFEDDREQHPLAPQSFNLPDSQEHPRSGYSSHSALLARMGALDSMRTGHTFRLADCVSHPHLGLQPPADALPVCVSPGLAWGPDLFLLSWSL